MIAAAVSRMLLVTNRNSLWRLETDSLLTEEASELLYKLLNLYDRETSPSASLPNLTRLTIIRDNEDGWSRLFHGATLGRLESVSFISESE